MPIIAITNGGVRRQMEATTSRQILSQARLAYDALSTTRNCTKALRGFRWSSLPRVSAQVLEGAWDSQGFPWETRAYYSPDRGPLKEGPVGRTRTREQGTWPAGSAALCRWYAGLPGVRHLPRMLLDPFFAWYGLFMNIPRSVRAQSLRLLDLFIRQGDGPRSPNVVLRIRFSINSGYKVN